MQEEIIFPTEQDKADNLMDQLNDAMECDRLSNVWG